MRGQDDTSEMSLTLNRFGYCSIASWLYCGPSGPTPPRPGRRQPDSFARYRSGYRDIRYRRDEARHQRQAQLSKVCVQKCTDIETIRCTSLLLRCAQSRKCTRGRQDDGWPKQQLLSECCAFVQEKPRDDSCSSLGQTKNTHIRVSVRQKKSHIR